MSAHMPETNSSRETTRILIRPTPYHPGSDCANRFATAAEKFGVLVSCSLSTTLSTMSDVTCNLSQIERGDVQTHNIRERIRRAMSIDHEERAEIRIVAFSPEAPAPFILEQHVIEAVPEPGRGWWRRQSRRTIDESPR